MIWALLGMIDQDGPGMHHGQPLENGMIAVVTTLGMDEISRLQIDGLMKAISKEYRWQVRQGPDKHFQLWATPKISDKSQGRIRSFEEIDANVLGLSPPTSIDRYFSLPNMSEKTCPDAMGQFPAKSPRFQGAIGKLTHSAIYSKIRMRVGAPAVMFVSERLVPIQGKNQDRAYDFICAFDRPGTPVSTVWRFQWVKGRIMDSGKIDRLPRSYENGLYQTGR